MSADQVEERASQMGDRGCPRLPVPPPEEVRKVNKRTRAGVGLNALNINMANDWRPTLPKEFYPGLIKLIWRCWDNDPAVWLNFDEIVGLLMGDVGHEIRSNEEPIFGSGRVIAEVDQRDIDLIDTGGEMVSRRIMEDILKEKDRELDILVMERDKAISEVAKEKEKEKMLKQLKAEHKNFQAKNLELKEKDKAIMELKTTGRTERPKEERARRARRARRTRTRARTRVAPCEGYVACVSTELAVRGIAAPLPTHVVHLELSRTASCYKHRWGRTGRGGRPLIVLSVAVGGRESGVVNRFGRELQIGVCDGAGREVAGDRQGGGLGRRRRK